MQISGYIVKLIDTPRWKQIAVYKLCRHHRTAAMFWMTKYNKHGYVNIWLAGERSWDHHQFDDCDRKISLFTYYCKANVSLILPCHYMFKKGSLTLQHMPLGLISENTQIIYFYTIKKNTILTTLEKQGVIQIHENVGLCTPFQLSSSFHSFVFVSCTLLSFHITWR